MGFPRQEYWTGLPFPTPGDLPEPGIELPSPVLAAGFFTTEPPGKPCFLVNQSIHLVTPTNISRFSPSSLYVQFRGLESQTSESKADSFDHDLSWKFDSKRCLGCSCAVLTSQWPWALARTHFQTNQQMYSGMFLPTSKTLACFSAQQRMPQKNPWLCSFPAAFKPVKLSATPTIK